MSLILTVEPNLRKRGWAMRGIKTQVLWMVFVLTVLCGIGASAFVLLPYIMSNQKHGHELIESWFSILTYIFSAGAGSIFTMIGLSLGGDRKND